MADTVMGSCLCGAIRYEANGPAQFMANCHCSRCRKQHGAAFATYAAFPQEGLRITSGEGNLETYDSSPEVKRQYCGTCGSSLFYITQAMPNMVFVSAGPLDDDPGAPIGGHIFVGSKAPWYQITDNLPQHEAWG